MCEPLELRACAECVTALYVSVASRFVRGKVWCSWVVTASERTMEKEKSCRNGHSWKQNTLIDKNIHQNFSESKSSREML